MKIAWVTDIHLNFIDEDERKHFYQEIKYKNCDAIFISGDIAEAPCLIEILNEIADHIKKPIYFILGNHDYYRGQISEVREAITSLTKSHNHLFWLPASGIQTLDENIILLGQDGWADGRLGDYNHSRVTLNDSRMIADLFQRKILGKFELLNKMQELADADAIQLQNNLMQAVTKSPKKIVILTHVPPFKEVCLHQGSISNDDWLPYFSSKIVGDVLIRIAQENPFVEFLALCGHTHSEANYKALDNLVVKVGKAEYYKPVIQEVIIL